MFVRHTLQEILIRGTRVYFNLSTNGSTNQFPIDVPLRMIFNAVTCGGGLFIRPFIV